MDSNKGQTMDAKLMARAVRLARTGAARAPISAARLNYGTMRGAEYAHETNDCAVRAIHMASRLTYAEAHALCKRHGRPDHKGMYANQIAAALAELGAAEHKTTARTVGQFIAAEGSRGIWLVMPTAHFVALVDGRVVSDGWPVGKRARLQTLRVWKLAD